MTTLIDYFQYPFFVRAILVGGMMSLLLSWVSTYIVLRQEVLFVHAISNIGFLGIALAILLSLPMTPTIIITCLIGAGLISLLQRKRLFYNDSLLEIFSQIGLALGVIVVANFPGYRINIEQFLFGDILGISSLDLQFAVIILCIVSIIIFFYHKSFLKISLSDTLSHSLVKNKHFSHALLIFLIATLIAMAIKIIGVLLVAAFVTIPSNTAKLFAKSLMQTFIFSTLIGLISTLVGLYLSILLNLPAGPLVVSVLGVLWLISIGYNRLQ